MRRLGRRKNAWAASVFLAAGWTAAFADEPAEAPPTPATTRTVPVIPLGTDTPGRPEAPAPAMDPEVQPAAGPELPVPPPASGPALEPPAPVVSKPKDLGPAPQPPSPPAAVIRLGPSLPQPAAADTPPPAAVELGPPPRVLQSNLLPPPPPRMPVLAPPPPAARLIPAPTDATQPAGDAKPEAKGDKPADDNPWAKIPPVQVFPRLGNFFVPPSGPGYYSFCDLLTGNYREKPPVYPYPPFALQPPSSFDADYRYLDKPDNQQLDPFDVCKRMHPCPDWMVTVGGQAWARYMNETNSRLTPANNDYVLYRARAWADVWYTDRFRVFAEGIWADITGNQLPPLPIDQNRGDFLNLFAEVKAGEIAGNPAYVRVGRQELLFGSQRLVSTVDWTNTRRTFEGVRGYWRSEDFDVDAFWTRPVSIKPTDWDTGNPDVQFYGGWLSFRPSKGQFVDLYYLGLTDNRDVRDRFLTGPRSPLGTAEYHTFGARFAGNQGPVLYDFEGMLQTGYYGTRDHRAYAYSAGLGYVLEDVPCRPQAWVTYDYASGTSDPSRGATDRTFNQLFAFGHYYLGWLDLVGRQNIQDLQVQVSAYPTNWVTLVGQCHHFWLAANQDFLYNAAGVATRRSPTGAAGGDVGTEIDLAANFHLGAHQDILVGYSKLFAGEFIRRTGANVSPELFYAMYNFRW